MAEHGHIADASTFTGHVRGAAPATGPVPALTIASHPMSGRVGDRLLLRELDGDPGQEVQLSRNGPDFARPGAAAGAPLSDPFLSRKPIRISAGPAGGVRLSAGDSGIDLVLDGRSRGSSADVPAGALAAGVTLELAGRVVLVLHLARPETGAADALGMVGGGEALGRVREAVERVSDLVVPVLVRGETGTGKELVARAVHQRSPRRQAPFVTVNLGAIPKELAASELFGSQRGAFTGATRDREGFFRAADRGTLFLDEIGEAPPEVQVMLLRVLETGEIYPVGASAPVAVDVRLIAATDADLEAHIRDGRFRAPLLHRLAGYEIRLPALRERREDIGPLFHHFAREELASVGEAHRLEPQDPRAEPWLPAPVAAALVRYPWPGNVRQLRNVTRQLVIGSRGQPQVQPDQRFWESLGTSAGGARTAAAVTPGRPEHSAPPGSPATPPAPDRPRRKASEVSDQELLEALRAESWDIKNAADRLGIPRSSIYDLIARNPNIRIAGNLTPEEISTCFHECDGDLDAMARRLEVSRAALARRVKELRLVRKER